MRRNKLIFLRNLSSKFAMLCLALTGAGLQQAHSQVTYTFTNCGATGRLGPTQVQVNSTYSGANTLSGLVTVNPSGVQQFVIPASGQYKIELYGASGGTNTTYSGYGAYVAGIVNLTGGNTLNIAVGQMGSMYATAYSDGGGGGSFVSENSNLLFAAGGGGGAAQVISASQNASILQTNANPLPSQFGSQGAGANVNGVHFTYGIYTQVAQSFFNGAAGQAGGQAGGWPGTNYGEGGFGGGGSSCSCSTGGGGGGGGYVGGGGGGSGYNSGTGGSSYIIPAATSTASSVLNTFGHGRVIVTFLCNVNLVPSKNPICQGESVTLSTNAVSNISWSNGSTSSSINVSPASNATYVVTGQAATGCTTSIALTVTVNPLPNLSAAVTPSVLCVGKAATVTASGANTYTWSSLSVSAPSATVNPVTTTSYNYSGTNQFGCVNSSVVAVNVNTNSLDITPNTAICAGETAMLTANNAVTYTWSTGSTFQTTWVTPITNTTYMASGTDINNCVLSNAVNITVDPRPNVSASASRNTICKGESVNLMASGANTYTWSSAAGTGAQVTISPPVDVVYSYTVTGTSSNGCTNTAFVSVNVSKCSGLAELSNDAITRVYPNPSGGEVTVELSSSRLHTIDVMDLTGRTVMSLTTHEESTRLSLDKLSNGVYYFKVRSAGQVEIIKVVKSN